MMEPLPELDPDEQREAVGCLLHPETWTRLRKAAQGVGRGAADALTCPVLGTSTFVRPGQVALIYDLEGMKAELDAGGFELTPVEDAE